jgi:HEAT repeat protein
VLLALRDRAHAADRTFVDLALGLRARRKPDPAIRTLLAKRLVGSNDQEETTALCIACGLAGASAARKTLADLAGGSNPAVAAQACYALGLLGGSDPMVKATLLDAAGRPGNFMVEREASLALGLLRDRAVVARLEAVASSGKRSDLDRAAAAVCLGRVGDDREIDFYLGLLADRTVGSQLRACVLHGLGLLLDRSEGASLAPIAADSLWFESYRGQMVDPIRDLQRLAD